MDNQQVASKCFNTTGSFVVPIFIYKQETKKLVFKLLVEEINLEIVIFILGNNSEIIDLELEVHHMNKNTNSDIKLRSLVASNSKIAIKGQVRIPHGMCGSSTSLRMDSLLLSKNASIQALPSLIIGENDVMAEHGVSIGQIDESQLFYLQSRGLSKGSAQRLICQGFILEHLKGFSKSELHEIRKRMEAISG